MTFLLLSLTPCGWDYNSGGSHAAEEAVVYGVATNGYSGCGIVADSGTTGDDSAINDHGGGGGNALPDCGSHGHETTVVLQLLSGATDAAVNAIDGRGGAAACGGATDGYGGGTIATYGCGGIGLETTDFSDMTACGKHVHHCPAECAASGASDIAGCAAADHGVVIDGGASDNYDGAGGCGTDAGVAGGGVADNHGGTIRAAGCGGKVLVVKPLMVFVQLRIVVVAFIVMKHVEMVQLMAVIFLISLTLLAIVNFIVIVKPRQGVA
ncbi:hypothetical protein NDU88_006577 [Pleurodeles waltl]|uniref:Uncharacterized protein n=1 Tax=Pleurodeles waltl TaxID=8319 RepID=A0AAV7ULE5_PLEWA|nr:hypothetical protein NDU88_006577 [Pleurodeles waltl]